MHGQKIRVVLVHLKGKRGSTFKGGQMDQRPEQNTTKHCTAVLKEALEMFNPNWLLREVGWLKKKAWTLGILEGTVWICLWALSRAPVEVFWGALSELEELCPQSEQEQALPQYSQGALIALGTGKREHPCWPALSLQCPQDLHPPEALVLAWSRGTELPKSLRKREKKQSTKSSPSHHQTQTQGLVSDVRWCLITC